MTTLSQNPAGSVKAGRKLQFPDGLQTGDKQEVAADGWGKMHEWPEKQGTNAMRLGRCRRMCRWPKNFNCGKLQPSLVAKCPDCDDKTMGVLEWLEL